MPSIMRTAPVRRVTSPLRNRLKSAITRVARREVESLRPELAALKRELNDVRGTDERRFEVTSASLAALERELNDVRDERRYEEEGASLADVHSALADLRYSTAVESERLARALRELAMARQTLDHVVKIQDENAATLSMLETRTREVSALVDSYQCSLELLLGPAGRYAPRFLAAADMDDLVRSFEWIDDQQGLVVALNAAYRTLLELELRCVGRFAGSTANILAKLAAIAVLPLPSSEVLEIGTLFGVGAVGVARQIARTGVEATLTIVDPFAGFQIQPDRGAGVDVSYTPATKTVVATNLALGGVSPDRYRFVEGRSADAEVEREVGDRRYGLIVIDGYHSEATALHDLIWAESLAAPGALVILDDYGDPAWPGVALALEGFLNRPEATLRHVGSAGTTAFLRATPALAPL